MSQDFPDNRREQYLEKPLPSSEESERVILGSVLIDNDVMPQVAERLVPEDLYSPLNRRVYQAMLKLFERQSSIDPILIGEELKKEGSLDSIGGITTITNLTFGLPHFSNVEEYITVILDKKRIRDLVRTCNAIVGEALAEESDAETICNSAEGQIFDVCNKPTQSKPERLVVLAHESMTRTSDLQKSGVEVSGMKSGIHELDRLTGGWQKSDLIIFAGRPSMGKTAGMTQFAVDGITDDAVGLVCSLEMNKRQILARMICSDAKINLQSYLHARLTKLDWDRIMASYDKFKEKRLFIDDEPGITPLQMMAKARRIYAEHKRLDLICVDYLGLMNTSRRINGKRVDEVSQISRELKHVAKELDVPVIALSQLSRAPEMRNPPRPILSDLRDSGSIEQDADVVAFVYRDEYYKETDENKGVAEIIVAKQRNGPTDTVRTTFLKHCTRFENYYPNN